MKTMRRPIKNMLALGLCCTLAFTGCSTQWVNSAEEIVSVLIPAVSNIISLVAVMQGGTSGTAKDLQAVQSAGTQADADLRLIQSLIVQYQNADAAVKPRVLNHIQSAISALRENLNGILPALHIKDIATQEKITAVVGIVLSEVESLAAIVPLIGSNSLPQMKAKGNRSTIRPPLGAGQFVVSYNATLSARTGNAELDRATSSLAIHQHGKWTRWASAGILK